MESKGVIHGQLQAKGGRSGRGPAFQVDHFRCPSAARIASRPSVSAAGPGCRISADLISTMRSLRTAGIASQPDRCRILSGTTFLPHQEARMTSGAAAITSCGDTIRSFAAFCFLSSGNTSLPPAISMSSETQPMPLTSGRPTPRNKPSASVGH
jgi:hypothetical protein